jgi:exopolyphosphatase/guanosine-5'-triphosphate,3'-diphosphate pyrophosphatase
VPDKSAKRRPRAPRTERFAVVDIGSNSIRLVVYEHGGRAPLPIFNEKVMCGLGRGVAATGRLPAEGVAMALANLVRFQSLIEAMGATRTVAVATAAVREAVNGPDFVAEIKRRTGIAVRVVSGTEEARLSALGVLSGIPAADGMMGDLGGGSLEVVDLAAGRVGNQVTLPLGPLRLIDTADNNLRRGRAVIERELGSLPWLGSLRNRTFYAVGGAWRMLARILMDHQRYPLHIIHHYTVSGAEAQEFLQRFEKMSKDDLRKLPNLSRRRSDTLPWAAMVLERLLAMAPPRQLVFSAFGLREGVLFDRLDEEARRADPLLAGAETVARAGRFDFSAEELFAFILPLLKGRTAETQRLARAACLLSDIAWAEHPDYRAEQAYFRVLRLPLVGIDHAGRAFLALAIEARYGGDRPVLAIDTARQLLEPSLQQLATAVGLGLRLAYTLSGGAPGVLAECHLEIAEQTLVLTLEGDGAVVVGDAVIRRLDGLAKIMNLAFRIAPRNAAAAE